MPSRKPEPAERAQGQIADDSRFVVASGAIERRYREVVFVAVMRPDVEPFAEGVVVRIAGPALATWRCLTEPRTLDEIAASLATSFGADRHQVRADIEPLVRDWAAVGVVARIP